MPSFASVLMVMFYMQQRQLLPSVRSLQTLPSFEDKPSYSLNEDPNWTSAIDVKPTIAQLFLDFFEFYNDKNLTECIISTHYGHYLPKSKRLKQELNTNRNYICFQDPFDLTRNQSRNMTYLFKEDLKSAFYVLAESAKALKEVSGEQVAAKQLFDRLLSTDIYNLFQFSADEPNYLPHLYATEYMKMLKIT